MSLCSRLISAALATLVACPAGAEVLRGTVRLSEPMALPADAVFEVRLVDASRQDVAATTLAVSARFASTPPPLAYALEVDPAWLRAGYGLLLQATVVADGQALMRTTDAWVVDAAALADGLDVVVRAIGAREEAPAIRLSCRGNEPFWALELDGAVARTSSPGAEWPVEATLVGTTRVLDWAEPVQVVWRGGPPMGEPTVFVARNETCLDTMADRPPFAWSITRILPGGQVSLGCCDAP